MCTWAQEAAGVPPRAGEHLDNGARWGGLKAGRLPSLGEQLDFKLITVEATGPVMQGRTCTNWRSQSLPLLFAFCRSLKCFLQSG